MHAELSRSLCFSKDPQLAQDYVNPRGDVRFGLILECLDTLAGDLALKHVAGSDVARVVTASVDRIDLRHPVNITNDLYLSAALNYVGSSSMEIGIRLDVDDRGRRYHGASCYFTFVGLDKRGKPAAVPPFMPQTAQQRRRHAAAQARRDEFRSSLRTSVLPPTYKEFLLWDALRTGLREGTVTGVPMRTSERTVLMYPQRQNHDGSIFGGYLMRLAYEDAWNTAFLHCGARPLIASVDRVNFVRPVKIGDLLRVRTRISYVGRTSMGVEAVLHAVEPKTCREHVTNACYFTLVAVDKKRTPVPVPKVYPETYDEFYHVDPRRADPRSRLQTGYLWGHRRHERNKHQPSGI